uniref:NmrA family NAD(P)-binding protein n=1 Tax=Pseudonocardia pini TaxID=2758030 RepID=UPI0015F0AF74
PGPLPEPRGPTGPDDELESTRGRALAELAVDVPHVVFSGIAAAGPRTAPGKERIEAALHGLVPRVTVLRPVRFLTNYFGVGLPVDGITDGVHRHLFPPDAVLQVIAPEDIADFTALALADPDRFASRTLELAGDALTPVEAAALIGEATGVPVRYEQIPTAELAALGPWMLHVQESWQAGNRWHADLEALRVIHPGLRTLRDWLAQGAADRLRTHLSGG